MVRQTIRNTTQLRLQGLAMALAMPLAGHAVEVTLPPGTTSWQVPAGVTAIDVVALGGGGGGGLDGNGGAGGQVTVTNWPVTPASEIQITIGTGGQGMIVPDINQPTNTIASLGGTPTTLTYGAQKIIAGGGGGAGFNQMPTPGAELSGGDGCGMPGKGSLNGTDLAIGGRGGSGGQGGAVGVMTDLNLPNQYVPQYYSLSTPGTDGGAVNGGQGASYTYTQGSSQNAVSAGQGGAGWGGGGGGGGIANLSSSFILMGGGGGGGSEGGACAPGDNGGARYVPPGGGSTAMRTAKSVVAKADPASNLNGGPGSITITYAISATLGGTISGLTASGLVLASGSTPGQTFAPAANAANFTFTNPVAGAYAVTVQTQPAGLQCTVVANGSGIMAANVSNVEVNCTPIAATSATLGGTITGLTAPGLVLASGSAPGQTFAPAANASNFAFANPVAGAYAVTVQTQPTGLQCAVVANGSGTIAGNVSNVEVSCTPQTTITPPATSTPTPVPSLGALGLLMLSGMLGWLGVRRRY